MISEDLVVVTFDDKRCAICDMNLVGSIWKGITVAIKTRKQYSRYTNRVNAKFYCVRCMTKNTTSNSHTRVKHTRTHQQLDDFVANVLSNSLD